MKKNQEVNAQVRWIHQSDRNKVQWHDRHLLDMSVTKRLEKILDRKKGELNVLTLHMRHG